ncbi:MAG: T9SS type A sorting domain-containing protein [Bacteroidota bacterium]
MRNGLTSLLCACLMLLTAQLSGQNATSLAANRITELPQVLLDSNSYTFEVLIVNTDPAYALTNDLSLYLSVDGDTGTPLVTGLTISDPLNPGDSLWVSVEDYNFDASRFGGGGITHDIIVWPIAAGVQEVDSARFPVHFVDTNKPQSNHLGVSSSNFPNPVYEGNSYDIAFAVHNQHPQHIFYRPISLMLSVDGTTPDPVIVEVMPTVPIQPGDFQLVHLSGYTFTQAALGGGGITHDIIVWPLNGAINDEPPVTDSFFVSIQYISAAAFEVKEPEVTGLPGIVDGQSDYTIDIKTVNQGLAANSLPVEYYVQLDHQPPFMIGSLNNIVSPGNSITIKNLALNLSNLFDFSSNGMIGSPDQIHTLNVWAEEQGRDNALMMASFPVIISAESDEEAEENIKPSPGLIGTIAETSHLTQKPHTFNQLQGEKASLQSVTRSRPSTGSDQSAISPPSKTAKSLSLAPGSIKVYPNPVQGKANFRFVAERSGDIHLSIYRLTGQKISQQDLMVSAGEQQLSASLQGLPGGIYLYKITGVGGEYNGRIIKK